MLDVERGVDVDAGVEQLLDVVVAPLVAGPRHVGVRQLVDQRDARPARQERVEVELFVALALVVEALARQDLEALEQRPGLGPAVGFDQADDDVDALTLELACRVEHGVGLADAGRGAEEDLELAATLLDFGGARFDEQRVGIGTPGFGGHSRGLSGAILLRDGPRARARGTRVESQVELEDVDSRLAEEAELAGLRLLFDEATELGVRNAALAGDAGHLIERRGGSDVRVEPAAGGGGEIHGNAARRRGPRARPRPSRRPALASAGLDGPRFDPVEAPPL